MIKIEVLEPSLSENRLPPQPGVILSYEAVSPRQGIARSYSPPSPEIEMSEWQPIETRPRREPILVGSFPKGIMAVERMGEQRENWTTLDGEYHKPTHWMSLPAAPAS